MIVMKFGGASLASPASIKRVAAIVHSEARKASSVDNRSSREQILMPVVVVSAVGSTTDRRFRAASRCQAFARERLLSGITAYSAESLSVMSRRYTSAAWSYAFLASPIWDEEMLRAFCVQH